MLKVTISSDDSTFLDALCDTIAETFFVAYEQSGLTKKEFAEVSIAQVTMDRFLDLLKKKAADAVVLPVNQ